VANKIHPSKAVKVRVITPVKKKNMKECVMEADKIRLKLSNRDHTDSTELQTQDRKR
jgi:hypothetical protein